MLLTLGMVSTKVFNLPKNSDFCKSSYSRHFALEHNKTYLKEFQGAVIQFLVFTALASRKLSKLCW